MANIGPLKARLEDQEARLAGWKRQELGLEFKLKSVRESQAACQDKIEAIEAEIETLDVPQEDEG